MSTLTTVASPILGRAPRHTSASAVWALVDDLRGAAIFDGTAEFARAVTSGALNAYWDSLCEASGEKVPLLRCPLPIPTVDPQVGEGAARLGRAAADLPQAQAGYLLSALYATLLPQTDRAERGVFFTPPPLASRLLDLAEAYGFDWSLGRVLDPAAGGGAFMAPIARRMAQRLEERGASAYETVSHVASHLVGLEIDPFSAWVSQVLLEAALFEECAAAGVRLPTLTLVTDALLTPDGWEGGFELVVGNPPYGRTTVSPEQRARFSRSLYGHANLYGLFTDLAVRLAKPGGLIAFVTPTSFLGGKYFKNLRSFLAAAAPPVTAEFIEDRSEVFDGVLQETMLTVYAVGGSPRSLRVNTIRSRAIDEPCVVRPLGASRAPDRSDGPWLLPRDAEQEGLTERLLQMARRLSDYGFKVSTGPLVWNRHKAQLRDQPGRGTYPLVWAESVLPDGSFSFQARRRNHRPYFALAEGKEHLLVRDACVLVQRTTAKEQDRRLIAAVLPEGFLLEHGGGVVENHLNMIRPVNGEPGVSLRALTAFLNSRAADRVFRCISGSVAVSAFELESLPLPEPEEMQELDRLVAGEAAPETIECFLSEVYGLTA